MDRDCALRLDCNYEEAIEFEIFALRNPKSIGFLIQYGYTLYMCFCFAYKIVACDPTGQVVCRTVPSDLIQHGDLLIRVGCVLPAIILIEIQ